MRIMASSPVKYVEMNCCCRTLRVAELYGSPYTDPAFHYNADSDPTFHVYADPDPNFYFDADANPALIKVMQICNHRPTDPPRLKGIVQPFELGGETRVIASAVK